MRVLLQALAPGGEGARLTVLIFHRVLPQPDDLTPDEPDAGRFARELQWLAEWFTILPLPEAIERLATSSLPPRAAALTFDDGYADNCTVALPILQRAGLTATFFIATGFLDGGRMWNDSVIEALRNFRRPELDLDHLGLGRFATASVEQRRASITALLRAMKHLVPARRDEAAASIIEAADATLADNLMMTSAQVRELRDAGMTIGAHTIRHPILRAVRASHAEREIADGKEALEGILGEKVRLFAYPNGVPRQDYAREHVDIVRRLGFAAAFSTAWGTATGDTDFFQIPRFRPWDRSRLRYGLRLVRNAAVARPATA